MATGEPREDGMIEIVTAFPDNILGFVCHGQVTRGDYETVLVPAVEQALGRHDKLRLYYETAADFAGIDPGAMWADTKVGLKHLTRWERIAVVSDVEWLRMTVATFGFLMPAMVRVFPAGEAAQARAWVAAD